jgi:hypothetical protein
VLFALVGLGRLAHVATMLRRTVESVEPQRRAAGVDDVVPCARGNDHRVVVLDGRALAVDPDFALPLLDMEELVVRLVHLLADLFAGLQGHEHELQVLARVEHAAVVGVLGREFLDVVDEALHRQAPWRLSPLNARAAGLGSATSCGRRRNRLRAQAL